MIKSDLRTAGVIIDPIKSNERLIWIRKDSTYNYQEQGEGAQNNEVIEYAKNEMQLEYNGKKEFALERFKKFLGEKNTDRIYYEDFQMNLTSPGKFYVGDALLMIESLVKDGLLIKGNDGLLSMPP
jgi:hypothetical protein